MRRYSIEAIIFLTGALLGCKACQEASEEAVGTPERAAPDAAAAGPTVRPAASGPARATAAGAPALSAAGRSPLPAPQEWDAAAAVKVGGAQALGCQASKVREWLRCTCRAHGSPQKSG